MSKSGILEQVAEAKVFLTSLSNHIPDEDQLFGWVDELETRHDKIEQLASKIPHYPECEGNIRIKNPPRYDDIRRALEQAMPVMRSMADARGFRSDEAIWCLMADRYIDQLRGF